MQFKKFNGTTWDAIHHKTYDTLTESLTAFPAQIQASGDPLTDYLISGNTLQIGTPSPEAPVDVVGCGVWDETRQSYKLPPTVNGTRYPIYLGNVQTTRRIKKYEITGNERWVKESFGDTPNRYHGNDILSDCGNNIQGVCSHYIYAVANAYGNIFIASNKTDIFVLDENITSAKALSEYFAQQYAAGTPVTVWYVLAEPETGIVNEPLHKIGDYADAITMAQAEVTIPTSDGDNTISFGTTVQPSAMSATFKGWHPVQAAKQYDGNDWD